MNYLSLFSGIGGLDLGLDRAGMTCVGQVERDRFCRRVLDHHWPEVPKHDDVRTAAAWWLDEPRPRVDVVVGGPPCQGHSVAGKQLGTGDERWGWPWFRSVTAEFRPPWLLIENVPNLTRTGLVDILRDLAEDGFDAWWGRVPAAALGAPHLRWRLFVIAAHPERVGRDQWSGLGEVGSGWTQSANRGFDGAMWSLADPGGARLPQRSVPLAGPASISDGPRDAVAGGTGSTYRTRLGDWPSEPNVGRVVDGAPARVDRLKGLGNAVVPAVGEYVGHLLLAAAGAGHE